MTDHGARDHATWSASATARNVHCPGAIALSAQAPPDKETIHSARGTACHQIAEKCLRTGADPASFLGAVEKTKEHEIEIDEELVNSAAVYVDYVRERSAGKQLLIEQKFTLDALAPPFEAGGTCDAVLYDPQAKAIEVVDLKNGMGVVDPKDNPQLRTYALGAMLASKLPVETVTVTIVQPRAPHKDGRIRSETFHISELVEWTSGLIDAMQMSKQAQDEFEGMRPGPLGGQGVVFICPACQGVMRPMLSDDGMICSKGHTGAPVGLSRDGWNEKWLRPGKCKFCPCESFCPALKKEGQKAIALAEHWFETPAAMPEAKEIGTLLDRFDLVESFIKAVRSRAHTLAEQGVAIPGYVLVERHGHRKWAADEPETRAALILKGGLSDDEIYDRKLKSPAAIDKVLDKRKALVAELWTIPTTGTNLVKSGNTDRPALADKAALYFEKQEN